MIENHINQRFLGNHENTNAYRQEIIRVCTDFVNSGLADSNFLNRLTSGHDPTFWSCLSEALLADRLKNFTFPSRSRIGEGPDFLIMAGEKRVWIEVICPEPRGLSEDWTQFSEGVTDFPHESILLRWTAAIKEKTEKLIGRSSNPHSGYLHSGIVAPDDAYVIAVNGVQLRNGPFSSHLGISQFPFAIEAVFPVGPYQLTINRDTHQVTDRGHQHRPNIINRNGAHVPAYAFLDPRFKPISAIWAVDLNGGSVIGNSEPMTVVHNPNAINPIPTNYLPALDEFVATPINFNELEINKITP